MSYVTLAMDPGSYLGHGCVHMWWFRDQNWPKVMKMTWKWHKIDENWSKMVIFMTFRGPEGSLYSYCVILTVALIGWHYFHVILRVVKMMILAIFGQNGHFGDPCADLCTHPLYMKDQPIQPCTLTVTCLCACCVHVKNMLKMTFLTWFWHIAPAMVRSRSRHGPVRDDRLRSLGGAVACRPDPSMIIPGGGPGSHENDIKMT